MIKGFIFDFNGTLFFDSKLHIKCFREYALKYGFDVLSDEYVVTHILGKANDLIVRDNYKKDATDEDIAAFTDEKEGLYRELCRKNPEEMHLVSGACELLDYLKENKIPYCIATGSDIDNVNFYLNEMGIDRWFSLDNIVYCDGSFPCKPSPDIYQMAAERLSLDPSECVVFEDGTSGMIAAKNAGVKKIIAVYEEGLPTPVTDDIAPFKVLHGLDNWRMIISELGCSFN